MAVIGYFDGACEPYNPGGIATFGYAVFDDNKIISEEYGLACEPYTRSATNNVAEYIALIKLLADIIMRGYKQAIIKGDSQLIIKQMTGEYSVNSPNIVSLYYRARELAQNLKLEFVWIPREQNTYADNLSKKAFYDYFFVSKFDKAKDVTVEKISNNLFIANGKYIIDIEKYTCECPDYKKHNGPHNRVLVPCKHLIAVSLLNSNKKTLDKEVFCDNNN